MEGTKKLELDPKVFEGTEELKPVRDNGLINKEYYDKFLASVLDQERDYPAPPPLINLIAGSDVFPVLTDKSFSLWQGKQKSKKTIALVIAVASFLRQRLCTDTIYMQGVGDGTVLWFDTEQGESYAARTMKMILRLMGDVKTSPRFIYCDLRKYTPSERLKIIQTGIEATPGVRFVVIDGLIDLLVNWREPEESHALFTAILNFCSTYNIHIAGVLHQNKADKNAREIVGTIASQKCEIEIMAEVDPDDRARSIITFINTRGLPEIAPFSIRWDKGSLPCIDQDYKQQGTKKEVFNQMNYERSKQIAESVFKPLVALKNKEALALIMQLEKVSEPTAGRRLKDYVGWGFVEKGADGLYRKKMIS